MITPSQDQIIEGLIDGDTVEDLLRETIDTAITKCQGMEAAKRQRAEMVRGAPGTISAVRKAHPEEKCHQTCPGYGANLHQGGHKQCPAHGQTCHLCQKFGHFAKVCRGRQSRQPIPQQPMQASKERGSPRFHMSNIRHNAITDPAPTISIHILSLNGSTDMEILPDSGANISAAGKETLSHLGEHVNNLLPSRIVPQAANRTSM